MLSDPSVPLYFVEGEKKTLKAVQEGLPAIGLAGLWAWSDGNGNLISDFDQINFEDRLIYIVPDNDFLNSNKYRKGLKEAVHRLADKLIERGAKVYIKHLPPGKLKGLDDFLCKHAVDEFKFLPSSEIKRIKTKNILVHPAYDVCEDILILGFRVVKFVELEEMDGRAKSKKSKNKESEKRASKAPTDATFYIFSTQNGYVMQKRGVLQYGGKAFIVDTSHDRLLLRIEDRWDEERVKEFVRSPISPSGIYYETKNILKRYIEFTKGGLYGLIAAWIIATYFFKVFYAFPYLFVYGRKTTGKTRFLELLERLCFNAIKSRPSMAALVDTTDATRGVFLIDQAEELLNNDELLGVLIDSYTTGGGKRRIVDLSNRKRKVVEFDPYSPKAFASKKELPSDLLDRCLRVTMLKAKKNYPEPWAYLPMWRDLRDKLYRLLLTKWREAQRIYQSIGSDISHRVGELWKPIETVLILESVSAEERQEIKQCFFECIQETQSELSDSEREVLEILLSETESTGEAELTVNDIAGLMETKPSEDMSDKAVQTWIGKTLSQLSLYSKKLPKRKGNDPTSLFIPM
jgi:hypothetical protein